VGGLPANRGDITAAFRYIGAGIPNRLADIGLIDDHGHKLFLDLKLFQMCAV
jgi:hypothetical protein